ncbi:MAG: flagellar protein FlaG [Gammaproteobacteria bacterium]
MINSTSSYLEIKANRPVPVKAAVSADQLKRAGSNSEGTSETEEAASPEKVMEVAKQVVDRLQSSQRTLQFSVDEQTKSTVVKVIDSETNTVIRQIPSEELLSISKRLEAATGVLVNDKA